MGEKRKTKLEMKNEIRFNMEFMGRKEIKQMLAMAKKIASPPCWLLDCILHHHHQEYKHSF